ncbi:hypothetical protein BH09BAC1_BH09BAC1_27220 [soil metagenome]
MRTTIKFLLLCFLLAPSVGGKAQSLLKDSVMAVWLISPHYSYQLPLADMADRFGGNSAIGGMLGYKNGKNWMFGVEGSYLFSNNVKDFGQLENVSLGGNVLIRTDGRLESVFLVERGYTVEGFLGKVIAFKKPNVNSGIVLKLGLGTIGHKIRMVADKEYLPQIAGNYQKGYDRLTSGLLVTPFLGYQYMSLNKRINFYAGVELHVGFTKGRQAWNFDTNTPGDARRTDMLIGFKGGYVITRYVAHTEKYYYY